MRPIEWAVVFALFVPAAQASSKSSLVEHYARNSSRDVKLPRALVARLDQEYRKYLKTTEISSLAPKKEVKRQLLNLTAELTQEKHQALHENVRIVTPLGGGVVDLSDFVTPLRGAFSLRIVAKKEDDIAPLALRVFFISKAKKRKVAGEEFGAGCDKYMEITSLLKKANQHGGLDLYTAEQRYLSVVGGTFVAVSFEPEALHVGSLTLIDSRYPDLMCE